MTMMNFIRQSQQQQQQHRHHGDEDDNDTTSPPKLFCMDNHDSIIIGNEEEQLQQQQRRRPHEQQDDDVDKIVSSKLNKLSLEERTQGIYELHGVANDNDNTNTGSSSATKSTTTASNDSPDMMILMKLNEVTSRANDLINNKTATQHNSDTSEGGMEAYKTALIFDAEYVDKIKLLCLKADCYDAIKATNRLIAFFDLKLNIFGKDKLCKDITLDDLDSNAYKVLVDEGRIQLLGQRDRAGRAIILIDSSTGSHLVSMETWLQIYYYINMTAIRDLTVQENGMVLILWGVGSQKFVNNRPGKLTSLWSILPIRLAAVHVCYDNPTIDIAFKLLAKTMESRFLCRCRGHYGTYIECIYELMTFGIPKDYLPFEMATGNIDLNFHRHWIETRKVQEQRQQQQLQQQQHELIKLKMVNNNSNNNNTMSAATTTASVAVATTTTSYEPTVIVNNNNGNIIKDHCGRGGNILSSASNSSSISPTLQQQQQPDNNSVSSSLALLLSNNKNSNEIVVPGPLDIVLGRGRHPKNSMGYMKFRNLIDENVEIYDNAEKFDKMVIASDILHKLNLIGCRFLKRNSSSSSSSKNGGYILEECTPDESKEKICHTFRNIRVVKKQQNERKKKAKQQAGQVEVGSSSSSTVGTNILQSKKRRVSPYGR